MEKNEKNLIQPALKCRGKEYLRIIYGRDYDEKTNLNLAGSPPEPTYTVH